MAVASNGVTRWSLVGTTIDCPGGCTATIATSSAIVALVPSALIVLLHI